MIKAKVIDLPKEGLTAEKLESIINKFVAEEEPSEITQLELSSEFGFLIVIYRDDR
jgi:hypothetical protein